MIGFMGEYGHDGIANVFIYETMIPFDGG